MCNLLTDEFIEKYKEISPPMTNLGKFVYYRTYSRFLKEEGRREHWYETVRRAVEYNCGLQKSTQKKEAEELFDNIFNLRQFLSGRTFWVGGTESSKKFPLSNFNCSFTTIEHTNDIVDLFYLMMLGVGVGFRILPEDAKKIKRIKTALIVSHKPYVEESIKEEFTTTKALIDGLEIIVGDSKEGWTEALRALFDAFTGGYYEQDSFRVVVNYNNIRPKGTPLKTFGGHASGHDSLEAMFRSIVKILKAVKNNRLSTIDCLDICNLVGKNVAVGGVRRTAGLSLFDINDTDVLEAKNNIFYQDEEGTWHTNEELLHRTGSNNSILFQEKPSREELIKIFEGIKISGEPGFVNGVTARNRFADFKGVNPCCEILLANKGICNLVTLNMMAFVEDGKLNTAKLYRACELNARASFRMATVDLELKNWDRVQKEHMLLGCSLTGWQDMVNALDMQTSEQRLLLRQMRKKLTMMSKLYSNELGYKEPKLVTTVKPEGTISLLPTVSAGLHMSHSPYYIRRVRINANDPLLKACIELGYVVENEVGQTDDNCITKVVSFPCKAPEGKTREDVSAIEQLESYKLFMEEYVDHNASNTITVRDGEWASVCDWVYNNWDSFVGVSFLQHNSDFYPLAPFEAITEEKYLEMSKDMKDISLDVITKYESGTLGELEEDKECSSGICPIR